MSDVILKSISLPAAASSGLSALAPVQNKAPGGDVASVAASVASPVVNASSSVVASPKVSSDKSHQHSDLLANAAATIQRYLPRQFDGSELRIEKGQGHQPFCL